MTITSQFSDMTSLSNFRVSFFKFTYWSEFHFNIIAGSRVTKFFIKDWPEIWKLEIPLSQFCPISRDWGELAIPSVAQMSLIKCHWMLQIARSIAFTFSELLRETLTGFNVTESFLDLIYYQAVFRKCLSSVYYSFWF